MNTAFQWLIILLFLNCWNVQAAKKAKVAKPMTATEKPEVSWIEPHGIQRGVATDLKVTGKNLRALSGLKFSNTNLSGKIFAQNEDATNASITIEAGLRLSRGVYEFWLENEKGESGKIKFYVDDLAQIHEASSAFFIKISRTPVTVDGVLDPMTDRDEMMFQAKAGQGMVFEVAARSLGSKANIILTLQDALGNPLAKSSGAESGDPLLAYLFRKSGAYKLCVSEETLAGSPEHFYRVSMGDFPVVTGCFPLSVHQSGRAEVELFGHNLPPNTRLKFKADRLGETEVPVDLEKFHLRKPLKVLVTDESELVEAEPNDLPKDATLLKMPGSICGRIWSKQSESASDVDLFKFRAKASEVLVIETAAMRRGSPADTRIEILDSYGAPVPRLLLQAVRDSHLTFRPIDSNSVDARVEHWEEMELNELIYLRGEVLKIFRMPQGPDSGFQFYGTGGKRFAYFDTSPMDHANEEPCYIVEPRSVGAKIVPNGLPVFPVNFENDDDGERKIGGDSRLLFTAPVDGVYLVRVSDTRGFNGENFVYRLTARPARQDFTVKLNGSMLTLSPGSGQEFSFVAERTDGFEGDIEMEINGLPPGFVASNPVKIQAGHFTASGTLFASVDAKEPNGEMLLPKITATAIVNGKKIVKTVPGFPKIKLSEKPKLLVSIEPYAEAETNFIARSIGDKVLEITIAPGEVVPAWLKIKRQGHDDLVSFTVENLPHGVIVDNIGLSGVLIPKGENERRIFLKAAKWVPETDRLAYCQAKQSGNPTSLPILIHIRKPISDPQVSALKQN